MWIKQLVRHIRKYRRILVTAPVVAGGVLLLRFTGSLQFLELIALDQFFCLRPAEPIDSRIVIVTIDESDIQKYKWPLTDAKLSELLQKLKQQKPRFIGLDLYRDLPIEPGSAELEQIFQSTPNLIGIQKVSSGKLSAVPPPPTLQKLGLAAASDLVPDTDFKIRRGLVTLKDASKRTVFSLGAKSALAYLAAQKVVPKVVDASKSQIQIGQAIFSPLSADDGGYVRADTGGYQILANFRNPSQSFSRISMQDVMEGRVPPNLINDKGVFIGVTAASLGDYFSTSYNSGLFARYGMNERRFETIAGVEIHANISSQIISAALDARPLIRTWSEPLEWLWILGWSTIGALLGWTLKHPLWTVSTTLLASTGLVGGAYVLFLAGWWVIVVPPLLAMTGSAIANKGYILWDNLLDSYQSLEEYSKTLEHKVQERTLELKKAEEKYRSIFENAIEGIFQAAPEGYFLSANPTLARIYGYESPEDLFAHLKNVSTQLYVDSQVRSQFVKLIDEQDAVADFESQVYRRDGSVIWIAENTRAVRDETGQLLYYEGIVEDITQRKETETALRIEQEKSERLLLNILPSAIAEELKQGQGVKATRFESVTILFSDIVDFTQVASRLSPTELVKLLNEIFSVFDQLAQRYNLEKIKTIGDAYMVVGGLPEFSLNHAEAIAEMALEMQQAMSCFQTEEGNPFRLRIGINTGPVVAGVIGIKKFSYDLWGDAVNIASRMESHGLVDKIQVTEATYEQLKDKYEFLDRGSIFVKGKGEMKTYFLLGRK